MPTDGARIIAAVHTMEQYREGLAMRAAELEGHLRDAAQRPAQMAVQAAQAERLAEEAERRWFAAEDMVAAAHRAQAVQQVQMAAAKQEMGEAAEGRLLAAEDVLSSAHRSYTRAMASLLKDRLALLRQIELFESSKDEWLLSWTRQAALAVRGRQTTPQPVLAATATPSVVGAAAAAGETTASPFLVNSAIPKGSSSSSSGALVSGPAAATSEADRQPLPGGEGDSTTAAAAAGGSTRLEPAEAAAAADEGKRRRRPRQVLLPLDTTSFSLLGAVQRMAGRPHYIAYRGHAFSLSGLCHDRTAGNPPRTLPASDETGGSEAVPGLLVDMEGNQYIRQASLASLTSSSGSDGEAEEGSESPLSPSPDRCPSPPNSDEDSWGPWAAKQSRP
jgi:hypothetical protein